MLRLVVMSAVSQPAATRILFADDDLCIRRAFARTFRRPIWEVEFAANGNEALTLGAHGQYDAVILDHMMPGPSGADLIHRLRKYQKNALFVVITGYSDRAQASCRTHGVNLVISKPWDAQTLTDLLSASTPHYRSA